MLTKTEILDYLHENKDQYRLEFGISTVALFGSYARDEQSDTSDIDLLITLVPGTSDLFEKRMAFRAAVSNYFSRKVDVCYEQAIKLPFYDLILKEAIYA